MSLLNIGEFYTLARERQAKWHCRRGQALYYTLKEARPDLARIAEHDKSLNPYHKDERDLDKFYAWVQYMWERHT